MRRRLLFLMILALHVGLRLAVWLRPVRDLDNLVLPDDAYLSLHIARSIAHGLGPFYGLAPTNGFQPLYVFLMTPVFAWTGGDLLTPVRVALLLLVAADALAMALVMRLARRLGCSRTAAGLAGLTWALSPYALSTSLNGLETSIAAAAIVAMLLLWYRLRAASGGARAWSALGVLAGIAFLARIDSLLLAPALALPLLADALPGTGGQTGTMRRAETRRGLAIAAAVALATAMPWLAYSWHWTHTLFPISGSALRYMNLANVNHAPTWANIYAPMLLRAAYEVCCNLGRPLALALGLALAAGVVSRGAVIGRLGARLRALLPLAAFSGVLVAAYALFVFGPWYFARYFYPLLIPATLAIAIAGDELLRVIGPRRVVAAVVAAVVVVAVSVADPGFRRLYAQDPPPWGYLRIGEWARDHFPPGSVIGGSQTGALGYFADRLVVVNLDGVVNRGCYEAMRRGRMLDYIRDSGVRYLLWQDDIQWIARETRHYDERALTFLGRIEGIKSSGEPWQLYRVEPARPADAAAAGRAPGGGAPNSP